jgi:hypothetical protein
MRKIVVVRWFPEDNRRVGCGFRPGSPGRYVHYYMHCRAGRIWAKRLSGNQLRDWDRRPLLCSPSSLPACFAANCLSRFPAYLAPNFDRSDARNSDRNLAASFGRNLRRSLHRGSARNWLRSAASSFSGYLPSSSQSNFPTSFPMSFPGCLTTEIGRGISGPEKNG